MIALCSSASLAGCDAPAPTEDAPLFVDVVRQPPKAKPATATYLIDNDRDVAEYLAEIGLACEEYGCLP